MVDVGCVSIGDEQHRTIKTATRIPARTFLAIVEADAYFVLSLFQVRRCVHAESVISVCPMSGKVSVYVYVWVSHSTVKLKYGGSRHLLQTDGSLVEAATYPRQCARTSRLLCLLRLSVLLNGNKLQVPLLVEGSAYGPVVRHGHRFIADAVPRELPCLQIYCVALRRGGKSRGKRKGQ